MIERTGRRRFAARAGLIAGLALTPSLLTFASAAGAEPDPDPAATTAKRPDPEQRVCRDIKVTGTHMRQRVCFKQREWDRMREQAQESRHKARPSHEDGNVPR